MGDSSLLGGRRKRFGREDYWYSNPVGMVGMFVILITCMHALMLGKAEKSSRET
jgi:hypothetical protein